MNDAFALQPTIRVAILDTGIHTLHPRLENCVVESKSFVTDREGGRQMFLLGLSHICNGC